MLNPAHPAVIMHSSSNNLLQEIFSSLETFNNQVTFSSLDLPVETWADLLVET
jgi:hypothetical protein